MKYQLDRTPIISNIRLRFQISVKIKVILLLVKVVLVLHVILLDYETLTKQK